LFCIPPPHPPCHLTRFRTMASPYRASWSHSDTPHSSIKWSPRRRGLHITPQQSQETDIHAPGWIRTPSPRNRMATESRLRPRGHWDRCVASYNSHKLQIRFYEFSEMPLAICVPRLEAQFWLYTELGTVGWFYRHQIRRTSTCSAATLLSSDLATDRSRACHTYINEQGLRFIRPWRTNTAALRTHQP